MAIEIMRMFKRRLSKQVGEFTETDAARWYDSRIECSQEIAHNFTFSAIQSEQDSVWLNMWQSSSQFYYGEVTMTISPRNVLLANLAKLDASDQRFAASLLRFANPSEKQLHWICKLADKITSPQVIVPAANIQNVSSMIEFIGRARGKLKYPKIVFNVGDRVIRLSIAGDRSRAPGSINVVDHSTRDWYGRIQKNGDWEPAPSVEASVADSILGGLIKFAKNPAKAAAAYGHLTGNCCFCLLPLTDSRSTTVGYGPICAKHYDLPWGE